MPSKQEIINGIATAGQSMGMTPAQVAGAVGGISGESGFNPYALNPKDQINYPFSSTLANQVGIPATSSVGLMQWNNGRYEALINFANSRGDTSYLNPEQNGAPSAETQLAFIASKENGTATSTYDKYLNSPYTNDPSSAATEWARKVEVAKGNSFPDREAAAREYAQNGTVQISTDVGAIPKTELQNILSAIKNDLFVNELKINWNLFFFKAVKCSGDGSIA
jgi:hypothetical protein